MCVRICPKLLGYRDTAEKVCYGLKTDVRKDPCKITEFIGKTHCYVYCKIDMESENSTEKKDIVKYVYPDYPDMFVNVSKCTWGNKKFKDGVCADGFELRRPATMQNLGCYPTCNPTCINADCTYVNVCTCYENYKHALDTSK